MSSRKLPLTLILFVIVDLVYSFILYYQTPLDGDIATIVYPMKEFETMMSDPFGLNVLLHNRSYYGPNRYFAHWTMLLYFKGMPSLVGHFIDPLRSIYFSCAIAKITLQM